MKKFLFILLSIFLLPIIAYADNTTISLDTNKQNIKEGDTITVNVIIKSNTNLGEYEYTLDYDNTKLKILKDNPYTMDKPNNATNQEKKTYKFKALKEGKTKITVKSYYVTDAKNNTLNTKINPVTLKITKNDNNSNSNYLSSLEVQGYHLSPSFTKDNTDYTLKVEDINKITIKATPESKKSKVKGTGVKKLDEGENKFEIVVTNNDNEELTYSILVTLTTKNKIKVKIENEEYIIIQNFDSIDIPEGYKEKQITIGDNEITTLYNETTKLTLIPLKDSNNKIKLFIYNEKDGEYKPYNEIKLKEVSFIPLDTDKTIDNYTQYTETINDIDVTCYKISSSSNFAIIYGINTRTGEEGFYSYNKEEETIQKYNQEIEDYYKEKIENTKVLIYILSGTTLVFAVATITLVIKRHKQK